MKKNITEKEYYERKNKEKEELDKQGVIDFEQKRIERMWDDPNVVDEDIPCVKFTFNTESGDFIFVEEKSNGYRDKE